MFEEFQKIDLIRRIFPEQELETFLSQHYAKQPYLGRSRLGDQDERDQLLSIAEIDRLVNSVEIPPRTIDMANAERRMYRDEFTYSEGRIDARRVMEHVRNGSTLILTQLQESVESLADVCRDLEAVFNCHVQTNIYLTPPGKQGFKPHFDGHDVLVFQLKGTKAWTLFSNRYELPFKGERFDSNQHEPGDVVDEFDLNAGDFLYLPKGVMHQAPNKGDEPSLHITIGLIQKNWTDLILEAVSEVAINHPEFRQPLPPGFARADFDVESARPTFERLKEILSKDLDFEGALDYFAGEFIRNQKPKTEGRLSNILAAQDLMAETWRIQENALAQIEMSDEQVLLIAAGGVRKYPVDFESGLKRVLTGEAFCAHDLNLSKEACEELIGSLYDAGVIAVH
jgi:ribosomal protein L16 Arg81 hydroxylase